MNEDRMAVGYEPRFDIDSEVGRQGELFITSVIDALRSGSVEVKTDVRSGSTGNLYVEFECRRRDGWHASGIATTEAEMWAYVLGDGTVALVIPTAVLRSIVYELRDERTMECTRGSHPTKGVTIPIRFLMQYVQRKDAA